MDVRLTVQTDRQDPLRGLLARATGTLVSAQLWLRVNGDVCAVRECMNRFIMGTLWYALLHPLNS